MPLFNEKARYSGKPDNKRTCVNGTCPNYIKEKHEPLNNIGNVVLSM